MARYGEELNPGFNLDPDIIERSLEYGRGDLVEHYRQLTEPEMESFPPEYLVKDSLLLLASNKQAQGIDIEPAIAVEAALEVLDAQVNGL